jgi:transposase/uncharacterized ParB-like nuclease family protein
MKVLGIREIPVSKIEIIQGLLPRVETHTVEDKVEEYREAMELGSEFPPITVWQKDNEYWLIDGMHRLLASKRLGRETIKAEVVELKDMLEAKILAITKNRHGLPLTKEEKRLLCQNLYMEGLEVSELQKIFGISERTIYYWTSGLKRREKPEELKEKALEMRRQGYTQEQVARELGVDRSTISVWENEEQSKMLKPAKIAGFHETPTPSEEEPEEELDFEKPYFYDDLDDEYKNLYKKAMQVAKDPEIAKQAAEYTKQMFLKEAEREREKQEQKRSYGGRWPNDPPPATEEELYDEIKDTLLGYIYQTVRKIGWEKTFQLLDEVREEAERTYKSE